MIRSLINTESDLIQALRHGEERAFKQVYKNYFQMVAAYIQKNQGNETEAGDIFQEVLFVLVKKLRQRDFQLTAKLSTYLFSIARNLWLQRLKKRKQAPIALVEGTEAFLEIEESELDVKRQFEQKHEIVSGLFKEIKDDCKKVIKASFYQKLSHDEIAEQMGYSPAFVRVKLHRCMEGLRKKVKKHPAYRALQ